MSQIQKQRQFAISDELIQRIDNFRKQNELSRSSVVRLALTQFLQSQSKGENK
jgi:metal-responsive CopG/Arc/MetJ family transcriptional regulator